MTYGYKCLVLYADKLKDFDVDKSKDFYGCKSAVTYVDMQKDFYDCKSKDSDMNEGLYMYSVVYLSMYQVVLHF